MNLISHSFKIWKIQDLSLTNLLPNKALFSHKHPSSMEPLMMYGAKNHLGPTFRKALVPLQRAPCPDHLPNVSPHNTPSFPQTLQPPVGPRHLRSVTLASSLSFSPSNFLVSDSSTPHSGILLPSFTPLRKYSQWAIVCDMALTPCMS